MILIAAGAVFLAAALGIKFLIESKARQITAAILGVALIAAGVYLFVMPRQEVPGEDKKQAGSTSSASAGPSPSPSPSPAPSPQQSVGPDCGMVEIHVDRLVAAGPALRVGATIALTGPDPAQGDGRVMWVFAEEGNGDWYAWLAKIDRNKGGFWVGGIPLGRADHPEDANVGVRTVHVMLMDAARSKALADDLGKDYRALKAAPAGATDLYTVPVERVCTPR
ncbi:hypothetical protein QEZ54_10460 [Catellatospora sp. KI3]|uniref:hypothetical protein n=1 Tax=Catellatospora sp. KI3 TaxID=3041620 RepID=UPI00248309A5|nr:hypothetical protein [Catellatospora sp. KI3]MDI1461391.1 hypothetical protein [Catellatospora sp. KI3]